jgi:DNA-binding transcriptional LysR family regulator
MYRGRLVELEAVVAVAKRRSFRAAAAEIGLSATALSQAVAELEGRLGVRLFNRTTRSVSPTAAGEQL